MEQAGFAVRLEWGREGARAAAVRRDLIVVVDVLRFTSAVTTAVHCGLAVVPCAEGEDEMALSAELGIRLPDPWDQAARRAGLSPRTYVHRAAGERILLPSPNGATCARCARTARAVFAGSLLNATAVARAVRAELAAAPGPVTVVACGERNFPLSAGGDGGLRFALEDYLGAGAVLAELPGPLSPEAVVCARSFSSSRGDLEVLLLDCASGRELISKGLGEDVPFCAQLDVFPTAPVLREGMFTAPDRG